MVPGTWKNNLFVLLRTVEHKEQVRIVLNELLEFMFKKDWRGACHESCAILYVLLDQLGLQPVLKVGEVRLKNAPIVFDHSRIEISDQIFDLAICHTFAPELDQPPTVSGVNLETKEEPNILYNVPQIGPEVSQTTAMSKMSLVDYLDKSPLSPEGCWPLLLRIGKLAVLKLDIKTLRAKYLDTFRTVVQ